MQQQLRDNSQTSTFDRCFAEEAKSLRQEARGTPHGVVRERLDLRARQAETAAKVQKWISSPGLRPPR